MTGIYDDRVKTRQTRRLAVILLGCVLLLIILVLAVMAGAVTIPVRDVWLALTAPGTTEDYRIIYTLRMPRVICAALAGANLPCPDASSRESCATRWLIRASSVSLPEPDWPPWP